MNSRVVRKALIRKSSLPVRWVTPVFSSVEGNFVIQSSRDEVIIDALYSIEFSSVSADFNIVDNSVFDKLISPDIPRPEPGQLLWHSIAVGDEFLIGDIKSMAGRLQRSQKAGTLPAGMGYIEEEVNELIETASAVNLLPSQKKEQFLFSSHHGQLFPSDSPDLEGKWQRIASATHALLDDAVSGQLSEDEIARPERLLAAMRHGLLNGGKRLRPFLLSEVTSLLGGDLSAALRIGAALELLHCHSLVHDDLPAMDDDDVRRGQPTVHKAFDEATAIVAGDALLVMAFDIIAAPETRISDKQKVELTLALSRAAGVGGMMGGQMLDLEAEGRMPDERGIRTLQAMKTGALIRFACEAGAIVAGAAAEERKRFRVIGEKIGLAFQLSDDLLDLTADSASLGVPISTERAFGKGTLPALHGIEWTKERLKELAREAIDLLQPYGSDADLLRNTVIFVANRKN